MLFLIKNDSKHYAYDSSSGACIPLTSLQSKICEYIDFPPKPVCPTSVRYALAKYDVADVRRAYSFICDLYEKKLICGDNTSKAAKLLLSGECSFMSEELAKAAIEKIHEEIGSDANIVLVGSCSFSATLEEIIKKQ